MKTHQLILPLNNQDIINLNVGDKVLLSGDLITARDAAHKRIVETISRGEELPFSLAQTALFYCGPSPATVENVCGAIGPTTSSRMDKWTPDLLAAGLRVMIGKGERSSEVNKAIRMYGAVYFVAVGGAAAFLASKVVSCETLAWPDLGTEAIYRLQVVDIPLYVAYK